MAIAAAAARRPRLVLADEPTGELDAANEAIVLDTLRMLRDDYECGGAHGHPFRAVSRACDRVVEIARREGGG